MSEQFKEWSDEARALLVSSDSYSARVDESVKIDEIGGPIETSQEVTE